MRIGIDIRALQEGRTTGVQVYIFNLLHALFQIDQKNHYLLFANSWRAISLPEFNYPNVELKITHYPNKFFNFLQRFLSWPKIDKLIGEVDLFFSPHWRALAVGQASLVVTFHDLSFETVPEFYTFWKRIWHKLMGYRQVVLRADKIIAVSESTKRDLIAIYGAQANRIEVIHSGVKREKGGEGEGGEKEEGGEGREERGREYFLCFGTMEPRKNIEAALAAYQEYSRKSRSPKQLIIAGSSGWKTRLLRHEGVSILQNVTDEQKQNLYNGAFVLLFLSFYEGFGFPILEAAARGVPVIASLGTSLPEIGHGFAVLVNPFRPGQIASAMLELESDSGYYNHLKVRGLETAKKFTWDKTARAVLELFAQYAHRH